MVDTQTLDDSKEFERFTQYLKKAIIMAFEQALAEGSLKVLPIHLFLGIITNKKSIGSKLLVRFGVDVDRTIESFVKGGKLNGLSRKSNFKLELDDKLKKVLINSVVLASEMGHVYVGTEHVLLNLLKLEDENFVEDLKVAGINYDNVLNTLGNFATYHHGVFASTDDSDTEPISKQSAIGTFAQNMNAMATQGKYLPIYGREKEIERLVHILSRKTKSNPILVGEAGVGKTAVVEGFVQRIVTEKVPSSFLSKVVVNLDLAGVLAGSKIRGDVEERIIAIIKEAQNNPNIILFIDEIHMIVGAGSAGQGTMDIANILKPYLTNGNISVIGATTLSEYQKYFEDDSALTRRFQSIIIDEVGEDEAVKVLGNIRPKLEEFHNVKIADEALAESVRLSSRYIADRFLPDKAIDILDEACAKVKIVNLDFKKASSKLENDLQKVLNLKSELLQKDNMTKAAALRKKEVKLKEAIAKLDKKTNKNSKRALLVDSKIIKDVVASYTKIPINEMDMNSLKSIADLESQLSKTVVGQDNAVGRVAFAIKRSKIGIQDSSKPLGSFLFLGPTGVGKTQLAKSLARILFGDEDKLIQVDMSEYMEQHSVSKLIGSPPGYVGFQEGGQLTEKIRHNPYSVILFDELEKAHADLLNILLQVLDEGRLSDGKGREVNFKNTVIIMTSNIGIDMISDDRVLGFHLDENNNPEEVSTRDFEEMTKKLLGQVKEEFSPELLNRIDDIVVFKGLNAEELKEITKLEIEKLNMRIREKSICLAVSQGVIDHIAFEGSSSEYGARNIKRKIQELIENPLADFVISRNLLNQKVMTVINLKKSKSGIKFELKK
jgi:ATP-dependent Clp protease ATP-binding subunit ClpC